MRWISWLVSGVAVVVMGAAAGCDGSEQAPGGGGSSGGTGGSTGMAGQGGEAAGQAGGAGKSGGAVQTGAGEGGQGGASAGNAQGGGAAGSGQAGAGQGGKPAGGQAGQDSAGQAGGGAAGSSGGQGGAGGNEGLYCGLERSQLPAMIACDDPNANACIEAICADPECKAQWQECEADEGCNDALGCAEVCEQTGENAVENCTPLAVAKISTALAASSCIKKMAVCDGASVVGGSAGGGGAGGAGGSAGQAGVGQGGSGAGAGGTAGASGASSGEGGKAGSGQAGGGGSSGQGGAGGGAGSAGQGGMLPLTEKTICGTWVLQQASSAAELTKKKAAIEAALSTPNVRGFSLRVPWKAIENDLSLLEAGRMIAEAKGVDYSIRFMAGRHTPAAVFADGAYFWTFNGEKIPKPFSDDGVPGNPAFEKAYAAIVKKLGSYSRANGVRLLHLAWHGRMWAEIDQEGPAGTPGYSLDAWLKGHQKLVDIGLTEASDELSIEFPMSGHWVQNASGAGPLASYMTTKVGKLSPLLYVQGNGLGMFNGAPSKSLRRGMQMFDLKTTYDWAAVYDTLYADPQATYVELYTDNFGGPNKAPLEAQITKFHAAACKP